MTTLARLEQQWKDLAAEREALDREIIGLHQEWQALQHFIQTAPKNAPILDVLSAQRDRDHVARQANSLQEQRDEVAQEEQKARLAYNQAAQQVDNARKALARCADPQAIKMSMVQLGDVAVMRQQCKKVLRQYGVSE